MAKKPPQKKPPQELIRSVQYDFFGQFVTNDISEVSNAIEIWDSIPKYFPAKTMAKNFTQDGLAQPFEWEYEQVEKDERGKEKTHKFKVVVQPALIKQPDGKYKAVFPSKTEYYIEEVLKKFLADQQYGFHDVKELETWVRWTINMVFNELKTRGRSRSKAEIKTGIQVMNKCNLAVFKDGKEIWSGAILQDLVTVGRDEYLEDTDAHHVARLPLFISHSINHLRYRQFNYDRLLSCSEELSHWIYRKLVHRYRHASVMNDYHFKYSGLKGSGLLQQVKEGNNRDKVISALDELVKKGVLSKYEMKQEKDGNKILEIVYTVWPSMEFVTEQKAANKRSKDGQMNALNAGLSLVDKP